MTITIGDLRNNPEILKELHKNMPIPDGINPEDYDPINDHHPDCLEITRARDAFCEQVGDLIDCDTSVTGYLDRNTGESFVKIVSK